MYLKEMATICISPLRIAFDHIGVRKVYETSVRMAADNGITSLSNYMLYNFMDTPQDLYERLALNIKLNDETGYPYLVFPYALPAGNLERPVACWETPGIATICARSRLFCKLPEEWSVETPPFFRRAFGKNNEEFMRLLGYPPGMIFHRDYFEYGRW